MSLLLFLVLMWESYWSSKFSCYLLACSKWCTGDVVDITLAWVNPWTALFPPLLALPSTPCCASKICDFLSMMGVEEGRGRVWYGCLYSRFSWLVGEDTKFPFQLIVHLCFWILKKASLPSWWKSWKVLCLVIKFLNWPCGRKGFFTLSVKEMTHHSLSNCHHIHFGKHELEA